MQQDNRWEGLLTFGWTLGAAILGAVSLVVAPPKHNPLVYLPLAVVSTAMAFTTAHYQHDITHMCGNIQHHTNFKNDGENGSGIKSVPHGESCNALRRQLPPLPFVSLALNFSFGVCPAQVCSCRCSLRSSRSSS